MPTRTSPSGPEIFTFTVSPNDLKLIGIVAAIRPAELSRKLMIAPAMMSASSARWKASTLVISSLSSTLLRTTSRLLGLTQVSRYMAWGAFIRPLRREARSWRGSWLATAGLIAPTWPSLPLTIRQGTPSRLIGSSAASTLLARAAGAPLCPPPSADRAPHPPRPPYCRSGSRTPCPPPGATGPPTHRSTTSLAGGRSLDPGRPRPQAVGQCSAPGAASHHPWLAPGAGPSSLGSVWPPPRSRPTGAADRVPGAGAEAGQGEPTLGLRAHPRRVAQTRPPSLLDQHPQPAPPSARAACTAAGRTLVAPFPARSGQGDPGLRLLHSGHRLLEAPLRLVLLGAGQPAHLVHCLQRAPWRSLGRPAGAESGLAAPGG